MFGSTPRLSPLTRQQLQFRARLINAHLDRFSLDELLRGGRIGELPHLGVGNPRGGGYDPNQPRVPAGRPDGGQWTSVGGVHKRTVQPASKQADQHAFVLVRRPDNVRSDTNGERYFALLNSLTNFGEAEKASYRIAPPLEGRSIPGSEQTRRYAKLRQLTDADEFAIEQTTQVLTDILLRINQNVSRRRDFASARLYGIAVHKAFADAVRAKNLPGIGIEGVEQSFDLQGLARYGLDGSIRTDVVLRNEEGTIIAIYDVKTGNAVMRPSREAKIRRYTKVSPEVQLIILHARRGKR